MKVAITARGPDLNSQMDARFGRAEYILVVDTAKGVCEAHENSASAQLMSGTGVQTGKDVVDLGVRALITNNVGPKAFQVLQAGGVQVFGTIEDTAQDALRSFEAKKLEPLVQSTVRR